MPQSIPKLFTVGFAIAIAGVVTSALILYRNTHRMIENEQLVNHTNQVLYHLENTLSTLKDAETGQRGYLLTGASDYLRPYQSAPAQIAQQLAALKHLTADNSEQKARLAALEQNISRKLAELDETVELRQTAGLAAAQAIVLSGRGKQIMDEIRQQVAELEATERILLQQRARDSQLSFQRTVVTFSLTSLFSIGLLILFYLLIRRDIAARQQAANVLQERENYLQAILDAEPECVKVVAADGGLLQVNPAGLAIIEIPDAASVLGKSVYPLIVPEHRAAFQALNQKVCQGNSGSLEFEIVSCRGNRRWLETHAVPLANKADGTFVQLAITQDITQRKQAEAELNRLNRTLKTLLDCNQALVRTKDEVELLQNICQIIVEVGGYRLAWIGLAEQDAAKTIRPIGWAGDEAGYLQNLHLTWADTEQGRGPTGTAVRTRQPCVVQNILTEPQYQPWRQAAEQRGYAASIALPLLIDDNQQPFGVLNIYAAEPDAFDAAEMRLLVELADDLSYGVATLRNQCERRFAEAALRESEERLRLALDAAYMGFWDWNLVTNQIIWSEEHERLFGLTPGSFDGTFETFAACLHPDDLEALMQVVEHARAMHIAYRHDCRVVWADGSTHWVEGRGKFCYNEAGEAVRMSGMVRDISARKDAEIALQKFADEFEELYNYAPCGYHSLDAANRFIRVNNTELNMLGYAREEIIGKQFCGLLADESVGRFQDGLLVLKHYKTHDLQLQIVRKDGSILPVTLNMVAVEDAAGNFLMSRSTVIDDTERQQAEILLRQVNNQLEIRVAERTAELLQVNQQLLKELGERRQIQSALQLSQNRFAGILEIASDAIISVDANQIITLFNQGAEKIFGYNAEEVIGQPLDLLLPKRFAVAHHQHVNGFAQTNSRARRMGERNEVFGRRKDGSEFPAEASISRLELDNNPIFTAILRDISERKQIELALSQQAAIIESSGDAIISMDLAGRIISWNAGAERLYGYRREEVIGASIRLIIPTDRLGEEANFLQTIQQGGQIQYLETIRQRKNGTLIEVGLAFSPVKNAIDQIVGVSVIARDITDRKQIDRMKDEFVSVVSHELRTPLTSIHGSLGMLASGLLKPDTDQGKRMLQIAVDSTDRLVRLINDILDIERIESGRVKMEKEYCQVDELITEAVNVVQPLANKAGVLLSITSSAMQIWADPDRIVQTLTNLLSNAIKFSPSGNTVWLTVQSQPNDILFTVKDQGRGIPADKLDSIFERFQQVDSSDSRNHEGTGLGLAICRSIVQQHGGQIWVESILGEGSTFFFTLPLPESLEPEQTSVQDIAVCAPLVLVCDNDPEICTNLQTLLERQHYRVITAASGQDAIAQAISQQPDVILLDLLLPNQNGWETMAQLKEQPQTQNIPIIVCSICPLIETSLQAAGCVNWVDQPLDEALLLQSLKQALTKTSDHLQALIVEDDPDLAQVLVTLFEQHEIKAFHAASGREAIRLSQQLNPELLILDLVLPEGDGFTVVEWLRQHNRLCHTPVVVYSARDLDASERDRLRLGQTEFLGKGQVSIQEFEQRVMALLQQVTLQELPR